MRFVLRIALATAGLSVLLAGPPADAGRVEPLPAPLQAIGVDQRIDQLVPLDLVFSDERGGPVRLGSLFRAERPVLLNLVYYECPMLCTLVLDGLIEVLAEMDWVPGREFDIVTVSIDPREGPALATAKKQIYLRAYGRAEAASGWHFLTGDAAAIRDLAAAVGFRYNYVKQSDEYAHPAALFVLTPEGRISRYLFGVKHEPRTLRLSLVEASGGGVGSPVDSFLLYCYRYDSEEGRYAPVARKIMRVGGAVAVAVLGTFLLTYWLKEVRHKELA